MPIIATARTENVIRLAFDWTVWTAAKRRFKPKNRKLRTNVMQMTNPERHTDHQGFFKGSLEGLLAGNSFIFWTFRSLS